MWGKTYSSSTSGRSLARRFALTFDATPPASATRRTPVSRTALTTSSSTRRSTVRCAICANRSFEHDHCTLRSRACMAWPATRPRNRSPSTVTNGSSGLSPSATSAA